MLEICCNFAPNLITNVTEHAAKLQQNFETAKQKTRKIMKTQKLNYEPAQIVRDYRIKVNGRTSDGYVNKLVGVAGLLSLVGFERANKMLDRAYACHVGDVCRCKVYGGVQVSFYYK